MCKLVGQGPARAWNATFGWRVITFSVIDFAHEHRASEEHRDRPDLRRAEAGVVRVDLMLSVPQMFRLQPLNELV